VWPKNRSRLLIAAVSFLTCAAGASSEAQIVYPYPYPPPYRYAFDPGSAVRLDVTPQDAEVFIDGYYAGIVDDFDGAFQRLRVPPGPHEITIYRDGYQTITEKVYLRPDATFKLRRTMDRLAAGQTTEPRPVPAAPPPSAAQPWPPQMPPPQGRVGQRIPPPGNQRMPEAHASGTLAIRVQPDDAEILIDGQPWRVSSGQSSGQPSQASQGDVIVEVSEGRHTVQIRKVGYVGYLTEVQVRRDETTTVDISLKTRP
jgi:hypothetical protein